MVYEKRVRKKYNVRKKVRWYSATQEGKPLKAFQSTKNHALIQNSTEKKAHTHTKKRSDELKIYISQIIVWPSAQIPLQMKWFTCNLKLRHWLRNMHNCIQYTLCLMNSAWWHFAQRGCGLLWLLFKGFYLHPKTLRLNFLWLRMKYAWKIVRIFVLIQLAGVISFIFILAVPISKPMDSTFLFKCAFIRFSSCEHIQLISRTAKCFIICILQPITFCIQIIVIKLN